MNKDELIRFTANWFRLLDTAFSFIITQQRSSDNQLHMNYLEFSCSLSVALNKCHSDSFLLNHKKGFISIFF